MGQFCCGCLFERPRAKILLLGLDSSGKTSILYQLKLKRHVYTTPTVGFNVEDIDTCRSGSVTTWDVGGQDRLRTLWKYYFKGTHGLIFVLDSHDRDRMEEAKCELRNILDHEDMRGVPFVVMANKQDLPGSVTEDETSTKLGLDQHATHPYGVHTVCAKSGEGLLEALQHLSVLVEAFRKSSGSSRGDVLYP